MSKKENDIAQFLTEPIKAGERIYVKGESIKNPDREELAIVVKTDSDFVYFTKYGYNELIKRKISEVRKDTDHIGVNPFSKEIRATAYQIDIEQLFWRCGFDRRDKEERTEKWLGVAIPETCLNPMVIDKDGNEVEYQRGLVWSLEQKQLLIESIYNHVEIGKFVLRKRSTHWVEKRVKAGKIEHTAFYDLVDGKQRFTTILDFFLGEFKDLNGNLFSDLSDEAQRRFTSYRNLTYIELDEDSSDEDVLSVFLAINFTGVPMSRDHINFVRSINTK